MLNNIKNHTPIVALIIFMVNFSHTFAAKKTGVVVPLDFSRDGINSMIISFGLHDG